MKSLLLLRGLPGAGKSTLASILMANHSSSKSLSADQYFEVADGSYQFDAAKLPQAHVWCQEQCRDAMQQAKELIIVANTFTEEWEMSAYFQLATAHHYQVFSVIVENRHGNQSVHAVSSETMITMKKRFAVKL